MSDNSTFRFSHDYNLVPLKDADAYTIPCSEWKYLKDKVDAISDGPWLFHTLGSVLLGAAVTTFISILLGAYAADPGRTVAWAVVAVTFVCGCLCLFFASKERAIEQTKAKDVSAQMEVIEKRYQSTA